MNENQWRTIPDYEGYEINLYGTVRKIYKTCIREMAPTLKKGIYVIRLQTEDGSRKEERIHKLMAKTYMLLPKEGEVLRHKNGDRTDNWLNNLEWIDRIKLGALTGAKSRRQPVVKIDEQSNEIEFYSSARAAAKVNYMSYQTIMDYCNGNVKRKLAPDGYCYRWDI